MYDIVAIGELLIDFTPTGRTENGYNAYEANPGGAPANMLVCAKKLGSSAAFIGKVGNDNFGRFLKLVISGYGICADGIVLDNSVETTLAFVHLDDSGNRSFSFYRSNGADKALAKNNINLDIISDSRFVHFGSLSLTDEPSRSAVFDAVRFAKGEGKIVSFDANWRESLWRDKSEGIEIIKSCLQIADIVKLSEDELALLTENTDMDSMISELIRDYPISVLAVTLGKDGCIITNRKEQKHINAHSTAKAVDSTGAGDCFMGALLNRISHTHTDLIQLEMHSLVEFAIFANKAAGICISRNGGIPSMPSLEEVKEL